MPGFDLLLSNLLSPIVLAFALGVIAGLIKSELELPEPVLKLLAIYLLFSIGRFDVPNAAAVAAHYGSVSSVTFFTAVTFAAAMGNPGEGYMTGVVALMEWGVIVALMLARWSMGKAQGRSSIASLVVDTLRGRGIILLTGGMAIGLLTGEQGWSQISPF